VLFHFASIRCTDCYKDAYQGQLDRFVVKGGCEVCYRVDSWREVAFDHTQTRYPLQGATPAWRARRVTAQRGAAAPAVLRFAGIPQSCDGCHRDPTRGSSREQRGASACERCRTTDNLKASRFDHGRDAAWHLDGAHAEVACSGCHRPETRNGATFIGTSRSPRRAAAATARPGGPPRREAMRRAILVPASALALVLGSVLLLRGQGTTEMPHGDIKLDCGECHTPER
jgi:hypothetical protein